MALGVFVSLVFMEATTYAWWANSAGSWEWGEGHWRPEFTRDTRATSGKEPFGVFINSHNVDVFDFLS